MSPSSPTSADADVAGAKALARQLVAFALPLALVPLPFELLFWRTGEAWPVAWAARAQAGDPALLYERALFSQQTPLYKLQRLRQAPPELLLAGSSRVMQFRESMFRGRRFYNGGGLLNSVDDLEAMQQVLASQAMPRPPQLVVALDPWWFKAGQPPVRRFAEEFLEDEAWMAAAHVGAIRRAWERGGLPWSSVWARPKAEAHALGLYPVVSGGGYRADGSWFYGAWADRPDQPVPGRPTLVDYEDDLRRQAGFFLPCAGLDPQRVERAFAALAGLRGLGVRVTVMSPPFSASLLAALEAPGPHTRWWAEFRRGLLERAGREGYEVLDASDAAAFGFPDAFMLDGIHPSEHVAREVAARLLDRSAAAR